MKKKLFAGYKYLAFKKWTNQKLQMLDEKILANESRKTKLKNYLFKQKSPAKPVQKEECFYSKYS